ncbi:hypothetical protein FQA39_LY13804 [Lamprigera yunnana]|nr:hypothetical protein FQA39_LY13804 [Lamprigera yunnana]
MFLILFIVSSFVVVSTNGHGMMLDPPNRSSLWRFNSSFPINYDDNQNFCGGFDVQWNVYDGRCGVCGDSFGDPRPRMNENTGTYGLGYIVADYPAGSVIDVNISLTANHKGHFKYSLCELKDVSKPEDDDCFNDLLLENGEKWYKINSGINVVINRVQLPQKYTCKHCVLMWHYRTGKKIEDYKLKVRVEDCKTPPCKLKKGKSVLIEFRFTTDRAVNSIKNEASAVLAGVPLPFLGVDGTPACENMFESDGKTKASCSLEAGKEYVYRNVINVLELYPTLIDHNGGYRETEVFKSPSATSKGNGYGAVRGRSKGRCKEIEDYKLKVRVEDCKTPPCKLKKGKSVLIEFRFTTDRAVNSIKNEASAVLAGVPLPFLGVDGTPACENMFESDGNTKASCSLKAGKEYVYRNVINVSLLYPTDFQRTAEWQTNCGNSNVVLMDISELSNKLICEKHFIPTDININNKRKLLNKNAVPVKYIEPIISVPARSPEEYQQVVSIGNCKKSPCRLRKGNTVNAEFKFTPIQDTKTLKNSVSAIIVGIPFPFIGVDNTDACDNIFEADGTTKASCPLKKGTEYVYKNHFNILDIYPITSDTMWKPRQIGSKTLTFEMIEEKKILKIEDMSGNEVYLGWESVSEVWSLESVLRYRLSYSSGRNSKHFYEDVTRSVAEMSGDVKINIYNIINRLSEKSDDMCCMLEVLLFMPEKALFDVQLKRCIQEQEIQFIKKVWMLYAEEHWTIAIDLKSAVERLHEKLGALEFDADHEAIYGMERYYTVQQCEEL